MIWFKGIVFYEAIWGIERDLSGRFLIVVGGPRMVVKGGPLGKAKWLSKADLDGNMTSG